MSEFRPDRAQITPTPRPRPPSVGGLVGVGDVGRRRADRFHVIEGSEYTPAHGPPFAGYQSEIFLRGMAGEVPAHPVSIDELARKVEAEADEKAVGYVWGGAGSGDERCARTSKRFAAGGWCRATCATPASASWAVEVLGVAPPGRTARAGPGRRPVDRAP